jgi:hypothetical protein
MGEEAKIVRVVFGRLDDINDKVAATERERGSPQPKTIRNGHPLAAASLRGQFLPKLWVKGGERALRYLAQCAWSEPLEVAVTTLFSVKCTAVAADVGIERHLPCLAVVGEYRT